VAGSSLHDFFHSTGFEVGRNLALFFVAVIWLGLAYWVLRDARRRIADAWLVGTATLVGVVPFAGPLVYLLFRPPETLAEVRIREVELRALETRLERRQLHCPVCRSVVEPAFLVCPVCTTQLKQACGRCAEPLDPLWQICPYCATPVRARIEPTAVELDTALTAEAITRKPRPKRPKRASAS
jgi:Double zinc ribbon